MSKVQKSDEKWREKLSPEEFEVTRHAATEGAFSGRYWDTKTSGVYACVCCGQELFDSETKYDSGSGWPSFYAPIDMNVVQTREDRSQFMVRTEVLCSNCEAHLGHIFPDGPEPTGLRFCLNSLALHLNER
ncbi:MAG: peptide-methionine (R)-S-oxide reductase MsrB [Pseudomonadales bacterium]